MHGGHAYGLERQLLKQAWGGDPVLSFPARALADINVKRGMGGGAKHLEKDWVHCNVGLLWLNA